MEKPMFIYILLRACCHFVICNSDRNEMGQALVISSVLSSKIIGKYPRYFEVFDFLEEINSTFHQVAHLHHLGTSYEGRPMAALQLGLKGKHAKKSIWLDGGIHGREHISTATVLYLIYQFIEGYLLKKEDIIDLLNSFDWIFLPVVNPDGYEFTFTKNRMWRKNRRVVSADCHGVDLNRNWNYNWGGADSADDPCEQTYRGEFPESEPEVANIARFLLSQHRNPLAFITYHSYGQRIFSRWDHTGASVPDNHDDLISLAKRMSEAIANTTGEYYSVGTAPTLAYSFGGGSADWAKQVAGISYTYLIELRDSGTHGFLLPQDKIIHTGEENLAAILEMGKYLRSKTRTHRQHHKGHVSNNDPLSDSILFEQLEAGNSCAENEIYLADPNFEISSSFVDEIRVISPRKPFNRTNGQSLHSSSHSTHYLSATLHFLNTLLFCHSFLIY